MRNKSKTTSSNDNRGGRGFKRSNLNSNASKNAKSGKPDKTKGLESHACNVGKSECYVKIAKFTLSHVRQEHELGNDIATAIEDGEEKDFTAHMPMMQTAAEPRPPSEKASEARVAEHELRHAKHEAQKEIMRASP